MATDNGGRRARTTTRSSKPTGLKSAKATKGSSTGSGAFAGKTPTSGRLPKWYGGAPTVGTTSVGVRGPMSYGGSHAVRTGPAAINAAMNVLTGGFSGGAGASGGANGGKPAAPVFGVKTGRRSLGQVISGNSGSGGGSSNSGRTATFGHRPSSGGSRFTINR